MKRTNRKLTLELIRKEFEEAGKTLLATEYVTAKTKMPYICKCGNKSEINYSNFKSGKDCKNCRIIKVVEARKLSYTEVKDCFDKNNCTLLSKNYVNSKTPLDYICECGRKSKITITNLKNGQRCNQCGIDKRSGENSHLYKPNLTDNDRKVGRNDVDVRIWRKKVFERDDYTCQSCNKKGNIFLNAHHLKSYAEYPKYRYDIKYGVTLCRECHTDFHRTFGYRFFEDHHFGDWLIFKIDVEKEFTKLF